MLLLLCNSVYALLDVRTQRLIESADVAPPKIDLVRTHHHLSAAHGSRGTPVAHGCSRGVFRNGACQWKMVPQQLSRLSFGESGCVLTSLLLSRVQTAH